jgi:predicted nucleic acid-binding protein
VVNPLFDTNILIDALRGSEAATEELDRYQNPAISIITWMEVLAGASRTFEPSTRLFLSKFNILQLDDAISEEAVVLRRDHRVKLADAVIWASARVTGRLFITRDAKDFPADDPGVHMPYRLS